MKYILLILISLVAVKFSFAQSNSSNEFVSIKRSGYSIKCPAQWQLDTSHALGSDIFMRSVKEDQDDKFAENVNILIQQLPSDTISLDLFVSVSEKQIQDFATDLQLVKSTRMLRNGYPYHWIVYYQTQGIFQLRTEQFFFLKNSKAYVVTFSTEKSKEAKFENVGLTILQSFTLD